ncbi:MAG: hypothetical protein GQ574_02120 [Crocinitomix sp.]|nr:hypothetical protein [Crocinitomix sp.]
MDSQAEINIYYSILIAIGLIFIFAIAVILFFLRYRRGLVKKQLEIERQESEHRLVLLKATLEVTEQERKRIAEELHDAIGSHLAVAKMSLNALKVAQSNPEELQKLVDASKESLNETINTVREISHDLYPPGLAQFGFVNTVVDLFEKLTTSEAEFQFSCTYQFSDADKIIQLILYRITQELITNTLRYANATHVNLNIVQVDATLEFHYSDNGVGFDLADSKMKKGLGFMNIESRLMVINGELNLESKPNEGFQANIKIKRT